jgi:hypothetical protein
MIDKGEWERMFTKELNLMFPMNVKISIDWFFWKLNERYFAIQKKGYFDYHIDKKIPI